MATEGSDSFASVKDNTESEIFKSRTIANESIKPGMCKVEKKSASIFNLINNYL